MMIKSSRRDLFLITDPAGVTADVKALFDGAIAAFGKIDILVNNAAFAVLGDLNGYLHFHSIFLQSCFVNYWLDGQYCRTMIEKKIADFSDDEFDSIFSSNVRGHFLTMREAATKLADGGRVINFSTSLTRLVAISTQSMG